MAKKPHFVDLPKSRGILDDYKQGKVGQFIELYTQELDVKTTFTINGISLFARDNTWTGDNTFNVDQAVHRVINTNDSDAYFLFNALSTDHRFGVDSTGEWRILDAPVRIEETLTIDTMTSAGFVKNNSSGLLSGGNSVDISSDTNLAATSPIVLTGDTLSFTFPTQSQPARALDTVYQNTTGKPIKVYGSASCTYFDSNGADIGYFTCYSDASNPPTTVRQKGGVSVSQNIVTTNSGFIGHHAFSFTVENNHYYKIQKTTAGAGAVALDAWNEDRY